MNDKKQGLKQAEISMMFAAAQQEFELNLLRANNSALSELLRQTREALA